MSVSNEATIYERVIAVSYFRILTRMLISPGQFFKETSSGAGSAQPIGCLIISALFYAVASAIQVPERMILIMGVFFLNSLVMPVFTAWISFMITRIYRGGQVKLSRVFTIYAYSNSITLIVSWIPLFLWITEPWKWMLVFTGLKKGCGFSTGEAILVILITICLLMLFFWSLGLVVPGIKA